MPDGATKPTAFATSDSWEDICWYNYPKIWICIIQYNIKWIVEVLTNVVWLNRFVAVHMTIELCWCTANIYPLKQNKPDIFTQSAYSI